MQRLDWPSLISPNALNGLRGVVLLAAVWAAEAHGQAPARAAFEEAARAEQAGQFDLCVEKARLATTLLGRPAIRIQQVLVRCLFGANRDAETVREAEVFARLSPDMRVAQSQQVVQLGKDAQARAAQKVETARLAREQAERDAREARARAERAARDARTRAEAARRENARREAERRQQEIEANARRVAQLSVSIAQNEFQAGVNDSASTRACVLGVFSTVGAVLAGGGALGTGGYALTNFTAKDRNTNKLPGFVSLGGMVVLTAATVWLASASPRKFRECTSRREEAASLRRTAGQQRASLQQLSQWGGR